MEKKKTISRRGFLKASTALGVSGVAFLTDNPDAHAKPLHIPDSEYGREKKVSVLCQMCAQHCPAFASVKDGKVIRLETNPVHEYHGICGRARAAHQTGN
jgi:anaerobic selenocysteine-containing dehydrogenase